MVITKFEKTIIPRTLEGQKFADEYIRRLYKEQKTIRLRAEDMWSIIIESQHYEEVRDENED